MTNEQSNFLTYTRTYNQSYNNTNRQKGEQIIENTPCRIINIK